MAEPAINPGLERKLEAFSLEPTDARTFASLEESLYLSGAWSRLAGLYECRIGALPVGHAERDEVVLRLARILEGRLDDSAAAERRYVELLKQSPGHAEALAALRGLHTRQGALSAALQIAELEEGLQLPPRERARVLGEVGDLWRDIGEESEAEIRFDEALSLDPSCDTALAGAAALAEDRGDRAEAIRLQEHRLERLSGGARADALERIAALLHEGDEQRARALLREALRESPDRRTAHERLLELERERGAWGRIDELYRDRFKLLRQPQEQLSLALEAAASGLDEASEIGRSLEWVERARGVAPDDPRVYQLQARACRRARQTQGLIQALERLAELEPPTGTRRLELAALHERESAPERAVAWLRAHLEDEPDDPEALAILDRCLARLGQHAQRSPVLERRVAHAADPEERLERLLDLGDLQAGPEEDPETAEATYRRAIALDPGHLVAAARLEQLLRKQSRIGDLARFLKQCAEARTGEPRAQAWCSLAEARLVLGDPAAARDAYRRALEAERRCAPAIEGLHRVAEAASDPAWCIEACETELELDPPVERRAELLEAVSSAAGDAGEWERARRAAGAWAELVAAPAPLAALAKAARSLGDQDGERAALERREALLEHDPSERSRVLTRLGELALERPDGSGLDAALLWYRSAVDVHPERATRDRLIDLYRRTGDLTSVVSELQGALERAGAEAQLDARLELARVLAEIGDLPRAIEALAPVCEVDPGLGEAADLLEGLYAQEQCVDELVDLLSRRLARERDPGQRRELGLRLADVYLESLSRPADAAAVLRELADPARSAGVEERFERALEASGAKPELESWLRLREVHLSGEPRVDLLLRLAGLQEELGRVEDAAATLRRAEQLASPERRGTVRADQIRLFRQLGDPREQLEVLGRTLEESEDPAERVVLRVERAQILAGALERPHDAVLELEEASEVAPLDAQGLRLLVSLYARTGAGARRVTALERLAEASHDDDERVATLVELSDLLFSGPEEARDLAAAERALTRLRELVPDHPEPFDRLARLYESQERHAELDALLAEWLGGPELATAERTSLSLRLARLRVTERRVAEAAEVLEAAREAGAGNAAVHELLLHCLAELGDLEGQVALCAERSEGERGSARPIWLERWLGALEATGASAEERLSVIDGLAGERELSPDLLELRLNLLREVERPQELALALETSIPLLDSDDPRRRVRGRELLSLYEGALDDPLRALALAERELDHDATLVPHAVRLAARVADPEREAALLGPLVESGGERVPAEWPRRLGLALARLGHDGEAERLLWAGIDEQPRDVEILDALAEVIRRHRDPGKLDRVLDLLFPLCAEEDQLAVVHEGIETAELAGNASAELRWLRRWDDLESLPAERCRRWVELEAERGETGQRLRALRALASRLESPEERAPMLAEQGALHLERGDLEAARQAYAEALETEATPRAEWLEAQNGVLERLGRKSERLDVLAALARHPQRTPEERARLQQTYVELLVSQPGMRSEAARELRLFVESDPVADQRVQVERLRSLLRVYEELERTAEWCALAEELLPALSGDEKRDLQRQLARRLGTALGAREPAIVAWEGVLRADPEDAEALDALTELRRWAGRETELAEALERRAALHADDPGLAAKLLVEAASVHWRELGDAERALLDVDRALGLGSNSLSADDVRPAHELRAELARHLGRRETEAESLRTLLRSHAPAAGDAERWGRLGEILAEQPESLEEAASAAERALELATEPPVAEALRGPARRVLERAARWERAADLLAEEVDASDDAGRAELLRHLAELCFRRLGRAEEACARLDALAGLETPTVDDEALWAEALAARGEWRESLDHERRGLEKLGERVGAERWLELSRRTLERLGDERAAREACDAALAREPDSLEALRARIELCVGLGDDSGAVRDAAALGEALPAGPEAAAAFVRAAEIAHRGLGDIERARRLYSAALERHSNDAKALIGAGEIDLERGQWLEAERQLARACELLQGTAESRQRAHAARLAARAALQQGRNAEASRLLEVALLGTPDDPEALDALADVSLALAAHGTAGEALEARLALGDLEGGERAARLLKLARAREGSGRLGEAAAALESAVALCPDDERTRTQLVQILEQADDLEGALAQLDDWLLHAPAGNRPDLALHAARLESRLGRAEAARARLEPLVAAGQLSDDGWPELARWLLEDEAPEAALEVSGRGLDRLTAGPVRGELLWIEARALELLGRQARAAQRACDALEVTPANLDAARLLAARLGQAGDWSLAVGRLERAIEEGDPAPAVEAELWDAIGRAYAGPLENIGDAQRALRRALECNPLRDSAREALADSTAFDPASYVESLQLHRELLEVYPARPGSWRALRTIAEQRRRPEVGAFCEGVLRLLGHETQSQSAEGAEGCGALRLGSGPPAAPELVAATAFLRVLDEVGALPAEHSDSSLTRLPAVVQRELDGLAGCSWRLEAEMLRALLSEAGSEDDVRLQTLPRRARRRLERALRATDPNSIRTVDPTHWRAELLAEAAAAAVDRNDTSFEQALLGLLRAWPDSASLDLDRGGRVGPATRRCPAAEALLLRAAHASIEGLE